MSSLGLRCISGGTTRPRLRFVFSLLKRCQPSLCQQVRLFCFIAIARYCSPILSPSRPSLCSQPGRHHQGSLDCIQGRDTKVKWQYNQFDIRDCRQEYELQDQDHQHHEEHHPPVPAARHHLGDGPPALLSHPAVHLCHPQWLNGGLHSG